MLALISSVLLIGITAALFAFWFCRRILLVLVAAGAVESERSASQSQWYEWPPMATVIQAFGMIAAKSSILRGFERQYETLLAKARWPGRLTPVRLLGMATLGGIVSAAAFGTFFCLIFGVWGLLPALAALPLAFPMVNFYLRSYASQRMQTIHLDFPYAVDLLTLSIGAGSNLLLSLEVIARTYEHHPIAFEVRQLVSDIRLGKTHDAAFGSFAERVPMAEVKMLAAEVTQAEQLGTPVADALVRLSAALRMRRIQEANAKAGQARVQIIVPGGLVFLSVLLILFAPIILKALQGGLDI